MSESPDTQAEAADGQTFSGVRCELCGVVRMNSIYSHHGVVRCQDHYICAQVVALVAGARPTYDDLIEAGWKPVTFATPSAEPDGEAKPWDDMTQEQANRIMADLRAPAQDGEACLCGGDGVRYTVGADADCPMHGFPRCKPHGQRQCATCAAPAQDGAEVEALAEFLIDHRDRDYPASVYKFTPDKMAAAILASDWLAQRDKDRDAAVAAKVAEQIAQDIEAARRVNVAALDQQGKDAYGVGRWYGVNDGLIQAAVIARAAAPAGDER